MMIARHKRPARQISMVPLINVVFLLLIFFLVAGTVEKVEVVDVEPPHALSGALLDEGHIVILLGKYDEIIVNDKPVALEHLSAVLLNQLQHNKERIITIKSDARLDATRMIEVMERAKAAGGHNISLITQRL